MDDPQRDSSAVLGNRSRRQHVTRLAAGCQPISTASELARRQSGQLCDQHDAVSLAGYAPAERCDNPLVGGDHEMQIFWQGSCSLANSYYFDPHGDVPLRPSPTIETMWRARRFPLSDYRLERLRVGASADKVAA